MSNERLLKLDLQFFSEEEFGAYDPSTAYEGVGEVETGDNGGQVAEPVAQEPEYLDFGGRKVAANDDLRGLHQDYVNQQRYITSLTEQMNAYKMVAETAKSQPQPQAAEQNLPSANIGDWDEDTWNKFYENPQEILGGTVQQIVNQILAEKVDPILEERQWEAEVNRMTESYPDFGQFADQIQNVLNENPELADRPNGLEDAYYRAKATSLSGQPSPEQLLQNQAFVQNILNTPEIQQQFLNQYLAGKQQINQQTPSLMGRGASPSFAPVSPESSPTTLREASRLVMKNLGVRNY